jgi:hypothetical protein
VRNLIEILLSCVHFLLECSQEEKDSTICTQAELGTVCTSYHNVQVRNLHEKIEDGPNNSFSLECDILPLMVRPPLVLRMTK